MTAGHTPGSKVFVISLHRVMTRSTHILLSQLGLESIHFPKFFSGRNLLNEVRGREDDKEHLVDTLSPLIEAHDAVSDVPIPTLYRQLADRWPDARFILMTRDADRWVQSVRRHLRGRRLSPYNRVQYGHFFGHRIRRIQELSDQDLRWMFAEHTRQVQEYFHENARLRDRLLTVDGESDTAGREISLFLGYSPQELPRFSGTPCEADLAVALSWCNQRPGNGEAHFMAARNLSALGQPDRALEHLDQAMRNSPDDPKPPMLASNILHSLGHYPEAADAAVSAIQKGLDRPALYKRAYRTRLGQRRYAEAVNLLAGKIRLRFRRD